MDYYIRISSASIMWCRVWQAIEAARFIRAWIEDIPFGRFTCDNERLTHLWPLLRGHALTVGREAPSIARSSSALYQSYAYPTVYTDETCSLTKTSLWKQNSTGWKARGRPGSAGHAELINTWGYRGTWAKGLFLPDLCSRENLGHGPN